MEERHYFMHAKVENKDLVEYLVEHGVNINKEKWNGGTPLFDACESGNKEELVKYLLENGADINKRK